jgi:hypothetical protein
MSENLEQKIDDLAKTVECQQHEIERLRAVTEIQNVMGRYEYLENAGLPIIELFAMKTPGVSAHIEGIYNWDGPEAVRKYMGPDGLWARMQKALDPKGRMVVHTLTTPVIEVAQDGKTAKAVWMSPGLETHRAEGKFAARWAWVKYACDFVKEDGKWKIWHFHLYTPIIMCDYYQSWVDTPTFRPGGERQFPDDCQPSSLNNDWRPWSADKVAELRPAPPEPYETWDNADYMRLN